MAWTGCPTQAGLFAAIAWACVPWHEEEDEEETA
jgi:hypothetical protein